jgi:dTDP-4-dehydrorhamnose reductase
MILIIGSNGQLGQQMQKALGARGSSFVAYDYPDVDVTRKEMLEKLIDEKKPQTVINCAAYTNVNNAENDYDNAYNINALGPKYMAEICHVRDIEFVHVSTDYVFSGEPILENGHPRAYVETDKCAPVTVYGKTKFEGERFVQESCGRFYILRSAWLYGEGNNFVRTMLRLSQTNDTVRVVNDQFGSPTSTVDLAEAICVLIGTGEYGLYHATCEGQCSWYDFASKIFELKNKPISVIPLTSEEYSKEYPSAAPRPKWSVLENTALKRIGKNVFRDWEDALNEYLQGF